MYISPEQQDVLSELVNIGFGRAAATLSVLVGQRVLLEAPRVDFLSVSELKSALLPLSRGNELVMNQGFKGALTGNTLLFMDVKSVVMLLDLLNGESASGRDLSDSDRDAMIEISNILLNSYMGSFANLLNVPLNFSVPLLCSDTLSNILARYEVEGEQINYTLLVKTEFHFANRSIGGYVILIIGIDSLKDLFAAIEKISNS